MDSSAAANCGLPASELYRDVVIAQSKLIDLILTRLIVLDRSFCPIEKCNWPLVKQGRQLTAEWEQAHAPGMVEASGDSGHDGMLGNHRP